MLIYQSSLDQTSYYFFSLFLALFLYRCDDFLDSLPHEEKSAFPQKMSKSDQLASESGNKIHQRFPVSNNYANFFLI